MSSSTPQRRFHHSQRLLAIVLVCLALGSGCAQQYIKLRKVPQNPLEGPLNLLSYGGPKPTSRTEMLLRRYDLLETQEKTPQIALTNLKQQIVQEPTGDKVYSVAELAYIDAKRQEDAGKIKEALDLYGAAVAYSYSYLFESGLDRFRNPYDPQFRRACDLYNSSLEGALRIAVKQGKIKPGKAHTIETASQKFRLDIEVKGPWHPEDLSHLEFVSQYEIIGGLTNLHHTYGLGVPLIAVRGKHEGEDAAERYYPPGLTFPVTAFLRVAEDSHPESDGVHHCVLELHDPLHATHISVGDRLVPLETDLTTPLAFFLGNPAFKAQDISTIGLLRPGGLTQSKIKGMYMVEPYDPNKIPVVMVHGLWSSPTTWMEMFNDLRSYPEIRARYQFWFYLYPTGQPFWVSAAQMRDNLADVRQKLDPGGQNANLDQMVLVGHSMGGLVSKLQTLESGDDFWHILSDKPISELNASDEDREKLARVVYFHPNPSIKRVITIGTPHHGSDFANKYTTLFISRFILLPEMLTELTNKLVLSNPGFFKNKEMLTTTTSIDSLAPDDPIFPVMISAQKGPGVKYHNIVGRIRREDFLTKLAEDGDGIVGYQSAHLDDVNSEIVVAADHLNVHRHPLSTLEVRRILLEHLNDVPGLVGTPQQATTVGYQIMSTGNEAAQLPPHSPTTNAPTVVIPPPAKTSAETPLPRPIGGPLTIPSSR
jgi:pimeloyl-ACP methyl ester carboxylesterase